VAVIGSQKMFPPRGIAESRGNGRRLGRTGVSIVGGMGRRIDTARDTGALKRTEDLIAVLPPGSTRFIPPKNSFVVRIVKSGGLISGISARYPRQRAAVSSAATV